MKVFRALPKSGMYAISESSNVYHLLYPDKNYTLCGFRAAESDIQFYEKVALHIVNSFPPDRRLCEQCNKMKNRALLGRKSRT